MPIARFEMPDGRIARFEVPEGTTPEQAHAMISAALPKQDKAVDLDAVAEQARREHYQGLSGAEQFKAGMGKGFVDLARGAGQLLGLVDQKDIDSAKVKDKALMETSAGTAGNIAGSVAAAIPAAFVPGANTVAGSALIGAGMGALGPVASDESRLANTAVGGAGGALGTVVGRGIGAAAQGAKGLVEPFTGKGQDAIVGRTISRFAGGKLVPEASPIPGVQRTLAEATLDPGIAQLERSIADPKAISAMAERQLQNNAARVGALRKIAGTDADRAMASGVRELMAEPLYAQASREGIDAKMADAMQPAIESLMSRPSVKSALGKVREIFGEEGVAETQRGSLRGLQMLKQALDDTIEKAGSPASSIGKNQISAIRQTRGDLISVMGDIAPTQRAADRAYASWSRPVNAMDAADSLLKRSASATEDALGNPTLYPEAFSRAVRDSGPMVKKATGRSGELSDVLNSAQMNVVENLAADLSRKQAAQNLGRAVGSNTAQNLASQNLIRQIAGPMGLPASFTEAQVWPSLLRPVQFAMKGQEPAIQARLAEALLNPGKAQLLMALSAPQRSRLVELLLQGGERMLPVAGAAVANGLQ